MKKKKIILLFILFFVFILLGVFFYFDYNSFTNYNMFLINGGIDSNIVNYEYSEDEIINKGEDSNKNLVDTHCEEQVISNNFNYDDNADVYIVDYFENIYSEVETSVSFKEKFKDYFVTIVDFIFYDSEINGYKLSDLSNTTKTIIISYALKIDTKIESYIPNYKENISNTSGIVYSNIKEKCIILFFDISTQICTNNEEDCIFVKDEFVKIKNSCKIGWDFVKELVKNGTNNIKEWYEIYSGKQYVY